MNRSTLKAYAPAARREFIQAVKDRAAVYGFTANKTEQMTERGDVVLIAGQPFPKAIAVKRRLLEERIETHGFSQTMEEVAYTWFNRFVAIRYMELHGYLEHGYRVLSHPSGDSQPEIVEHAARVNFSGLDKARVVDLKLDGTKQEELYRLLLLAQCNSLNKAMPFLFEKIDDETELLLPLNLLPSDSLIRKLVNGIDESDWQEVEILGWLYQFYISERQDEVIGKVVASGDIPAATQLFTPNWIVKYLVQNTLGRQWLATYPQSGIRQQMEFYIEPAEQTPEVQEQLKAITPSSLNPEELTFLDPACGSAHILVEAYDLLKAIYLERGYRDKDIPALILQRNLIGLEIDDRAAQLAGFALFMKARADDRRIFESGVQPNILSFVESKGMDVGAITHALNSPINGGAEGTVAKADIAALLELFEEAKTCGSLIQIPSAFVEKLPTIEERLAVVLKDGDLTHAQAGVIAPLLRQAKLLSQKYDSVVANPPYMGSKAMNAELKAFTKEMYPSSKADTFALFMERSFSLAKESGHVGKVTMQSWMFLSSYEELRSSLLNNQSLICMAHLGPRGFDSISGEVVQTTAYVSINQPFSEIKSVFHRLLAGKSEAEKERDCLEAIRNKSCGWFYEAKPDDFKKIPGSPIAYWVSERLRECFKEGTPLGEVAEPTGGMTTGNNDKFLRLWHEVSQSKFGKGFRDRKSASESGMTWFPYNKGGEYRKWFGNNLYVVNWRQDGKDIIESGRAYPRSKDYYFRPALTWSFISSSFFGVRCSDAGFLFDVAGSSAFPPDEWRECIAGFLCSSIAFDMMKVLNPTMNFQVGNVAALPILKTQVLAQKQTIDAVVQQAVQIAHTDWDSFETSWDFKTLPVLQHQAQTLSASQEAADAECRSCFAVMKQLEEENNRLCIDAYGLQDELSPDVPDDQITLWSPDRERDIKRLISYAVGCMMGRYSLDKEGLIYAHSGNEGFDMSQYSTFPADEDGIIPVTETEWFDDDAANRFDRFLKAVWSSSTLEENLLFVAGGLGQKKTEEGSNTIRRYFSSDFYKDHLQTYKNRPIYWLFSSGKQGAFEALVYLHRYNEGTLSRMRTEYVVPLLGKLNGRIKLHIETLATATSNVQRKTAQKEKDLLTKQAVELQAFDEKLRHYASQRITLDLDDGVKVNYSKFGELLKDVKKVCGTKDED